MTKFGTVMRLGPADTGSKQKFTISKIQDGGGRHLEKSENLNIFVVSSQPTDQFITKFDMLIRLATLEPSSE